MSLSSNEGNGVSFNVSKIRVKEQVSNEPDSVTQGAVSQFELEKEKAAHQRKEDRAKKSSSLADAIKWIVILYLSAVLGIVIWQGMVSVDFRLDKSVMITLLTTTTANVISLLYLLIKYVFDDWLQR